MRIHADPDPDPQHWFVEQFSVGVNKVCGTVLSRGQQGLCCETVLSRGLTRFVEQFSVGVQQGLCCGPFSVRVLTSFVEQFSVSV